MGIYNKIQIAAKILLSRFLVCICCCLSILASQVDIEYNNSWAVVIGIDDYENDNITDLNYAVSDAAGIREMLIEYYGFPADNITSLINDEASATNIKRAIAKTAKNANENDRIIIFFAGHGMTEDLPSGGEMGYLIPYEGDLEDLYLSSVPMKELRNLSDRFNAKHVLFLVDACYGGLAAVGTRGLSTKVAGYYDKIFRGKARQIITAGGKGETVIEKADWGHSAFTFNLLRGLKDWMADLDNDGVITGEELGIYLKKRVTEDSELHQTPTVGRFSTDQGEVLFVRPEQLGGPVQNTGGNASVDQGNMMELQRENAELMSKLSKKFKPNYSTAKRLSLIFPGMGHLYLKERKKGLLWSALGSASFGGFVYSAMNFVDANEKYTKAKDNYLSATSNFNYHNVEYQNSTKDRTSAIQMLAGTSTAYLFVLTFNRLSIGKEQGNKTAIIKSKNLKTGVNPMGQFFLQYKF